MYKVIEIFNSIDGEGRRAGELTTFIRLSGCNLSCSWCDTQYSQDGTCGNYLTLDEIIETVESFKCYNITLTGGEPLIHPGVEDLIEELLHLGYDVNVETNGSIDPLPFIENPKFNNQEGFLWFTIDYKAESSGMQHKMKLDHFMHLRYQDVIKFVVGSRKECEDAHNVITKLPVSYGVDRSTKHSEDLDAPSIYFSPVFGMIEPVEIVNFMKEKHYNRRVKVQLQLHKLIWDPKMKGV